MLAVTLPRVASSTEQWQALRRVSTGCRKETLERRAETRSIQRGLTGWILSRSFSSTVMRSSA